MLANRLRLLAVALAGLSLVLASSAAWGTLYGPVVVLPPHAPNWPTIRAINRKGQIAGSLPWDSCESHAAVWDASTATIVRVLPWHGSEAVGIDDRGRVAVNHWWDGPDGPCERAYLWDGRYHSLGTLGGRHVTTAFAMNARGEVAGYSELSPYPYPPNYYGQYHAFRWDGAMLDLGDLNENSGSEGFDINNRGQVVGESGFLAWPGLYTLRAFLWDGAMRNLGVLPRDWDPPNGAYGESQAYRVNDQGQAVGYSRGDSGCYYPPHAVLWDSAGIHDLSAPGFEWGTAEAINNKGQIVGVGGSEGWLWEDGEYRMSTPWYPVDINDDGCIVGNRGWLLRPVKWALLYYFCDANNLSASMEVKFRSLAAGASNPNVAIFVLWDHSNPADPDAIYRVSTNADWRTYPRAGQLMEPGGGYMWLPEDLGLPNELNVGDPTTLTTFVNWVLAEHDGRTMLALCDHGWGVEPSAARANRARPTGIGEDQSGDYLSLDELRTAFDALTKPINVVHLDACLMGLLEVVYQLEGTNGCPGYLVASQDRGWSIAPWSWEKEYVPAVSASTTPRDLAQQAANWYYEYEVGAGKPVTVSVFHMRRTPTVIDRFKRFARALRAGIPRHAGAIREAWEQTQKFNENQDSEIDNLDAYLDLRHLADNVDYLVTGSDEAAVELHQSAGRLWHALALGPENMVIVNKSKSGGPGYSFEWGRRGETSTNGLSIFFPARRDHWMLAKYCTLGPTGANLRLVQDTEWGEFLREFRLEPSLELTGEKGYEADGVEPDSGVADSTRFVFRVKLTDPDGDEPKWVRVTVLNADGEAVEYKLRGGAGSTETGRVYQTAVRLPQDPAYVYYFTARDHDGDACGPAALPRTFSGPTVTGGASSLALSALAAVPTAGGAQITFSLARAADVTATVLNVAGRPIRTIAAAKPFAAGGQTLLWDARAETGLSAPAGVYVIRVTARTEDGAQSSALTTVRISR